MKMVTKEIEKLFNKYPLLSQDGKGDEAKVICKFFNPYGSQRWYILEAGEEVDGDRMLYCLCTSNGDAEYGYQALSEFLECRIDLYGMKMKLERDRYFSGTVADAKRESFVRS